MPSNLNHLLHLVRLAGCHIKHVTSPPQLAFPLLRTHAPPPWAQPPFCSPWAPRRPQLTQRQLQTCRELAAPRSAPPPAPAAWPCPPPAGRYPCGCVTQLASSLCLSCIPQPHTSVCCTVWEHTSVSCMAWLHASAVCLSYIPQLHASLSCMAWQHASAMCLSRRIASLTSNCVHSQGVCLSCMPQQAHCVPDKQLCALPRCVPQLHVPDRRCMSLTGACAP